MAFASPSPSSRKVISITDTATSGTVLYPFTIPQDSDSIVAKVWLQGTWSASGTATIVFQTSEDGGTTWRDVAGTTIGAATVAASMNNTNAHFISIACIGSNAKGAANYVGSVAASSAGVTAVNASAVGTVTGLPMLGTAGRIQIVYTATISTGGVNIDVFAPTAEMR